MTNPKIFKYDFTQSLTGIEAFVGVFEKKLQYIHDDIPVFFINSGDETYLFKQKFEKLNNRSEIYLSTPRVVFDIEDIMLQQDQNTSQYVKFNYAFNDGIWSGQFRRQSVVIPISINLVVPTVLKSLEYFDLLASVLSIDNVFTYDFLGNSQDASFNAQTFSFEKATMEQGSQAKNYVVKAALELVLQIYYPRYNTLTQLDGFKMDEKDKLSFEIVTKDSTNTSQTDNLNNPPDDCNCV